MFFPDRNYLYELLNKNQKPETILSKDNLQTTSPTTTTESPLANEDDENNSCRFDEESVSLDELIKNLIKIVRKLSVLRRIRRELPMKTYVKVAFRKNEYCK